MIKQYLLVGAVLFWQATCVFGQSDQPALLLQPTDWGFERIDLPLGFAPDMTLTGFEELRFAPGWSKPDSPNYFSYAFGLSLENEAKFKRKKIVDFITQYYRGLSAAVAEGKDFTVDVSEITVEVKKQSKGQYEVDVLFLDSFNGGEAVPLQMEMWVFADRKAGTSKVISIVSSKDKTATVWEELRDLRRQAVAGF